MRRPDLDFGVTDGENFIVTEGPYEKHLEVTAEIKEKAPVWILGSNSYFITADSVDQENTVSQSLRC